MSGHVLCIIWMYRFVPPQFDVPSLVYTLVHPHWVGVAHETFKEDMGCTC